MGTSATCCPSVFLLWPGHLAGCFKPSVRLHATCSLQFSPAPVLPLLAPFMEGSAAGPLLAPLIIHAMPETRLAKRCIKSMWNQLGSVGACVAWLRLHLLQNRRPQSGAATVPKAAPDQSLRPARRRHFFESHPMLAVCHQLSQSPGVSASQAVVDVLGALEVEAHVVLRGALRERRGREGWQTTSALVLLQVKTPELLQLPACCRPGEWRRRGVPRGSSCGRRCA